MRFATVEATRQARAALAAGEQPREDRDERRARAPAATSWKMRSGSGTRRRTRRGRARPNVVPMTASRIQPRTRETRNAAVTMRPARASVRAVTRGHAAVGRPAVARGCAARYAVRSRVGETWV